MLKTLVKLQTLDLFKKDEEGASLIEYSLLIGLITVLVIGLVISMGTWVNNQWSNLVSATGA